MNSATRIIAASALIAIFPGVPATHAEKPPTVAVEITPLTAAEMATAIRTDAITMPTPGEFFAAIQKTTKPSWSLQYREPIPTAFTSRAQLALNLGGLIADGYIAVEAQDGQQVKNIGRDVLTLAKTLGVSQNVLARGNSITDFAENNEWSALKEELEATQNEVKQTMEEQRDQDLVSLVSLGAWIRGLQAVSGVVDREYSKESAALLRQPQIVAYLRGKLATLPPKLQADALVVILSGQLEGIEKQVTFPEGSGPTPDQVKALNASVTELLREISTKGK